MPRGYSISNVIDSAARSSSTAWSIWPICGRGSCVATDAGKLILKVKTAKDAKNAKHRYLLNNMRENCLKPSAQDDAQQSRHFPALLGVLCVLRLILSV